MRFLMILACLAILHTLPAMAGQDVQQGFSRDAVQVVPVQADKSIVYVAPEFDIGGATARLVAQMARKTGMTVSVSVVAPGAPDGAFGAAMDTHGQALPMARVNDQFVIKLSREYLLANQQKGMQFILLGKDGKAITMSAAYVQSFVDAMPADLMQQLAKMEADCRRIDGHTGSRLVTARLAPTCAR